jgi:Polysaccharide pyruvyl transferase
MSRDPLFRSDLPAESAARHPGDPIHPRIGVWGRFDSGFADLVQPWILERELRRRLPESEVQAYAPLEEGRAISSDPGLATVDLGEWSPRRAYELSESLDCVVVAGDLFGVSDGRTPNPFLIEGLGRELEEACPVAWSAVSVAFDLEPEEGERLRLALAGRPYLSVRDETSRLRLRRAGIESEVALVPDPILLLPRAFPDEVLARRLEYLKHMEWFPRSGEPLVIQPGPLLAERAEELAATVATALERSPTPVVLLELGPGEGDGRLADALSRHPSIPTFRLPSGAAVSDIAAVLAHSRAFLGTSARASVACSAFGVPAFVLDRSLGGTSRELVLAIRRLLRTPAGAGADPAETAKLDAHFDRLAGLAEAALVRRIRREGASEEVVLARLRENERVLDSWRTAHAARSQQVVDLRLRSAALSEKTQKLAAEVQTLQDEAARRHHAWASATEELATELAKHESASRELEIEREVSARALAERDELAREAEGIRTRQARVESELAESRAQRKLEAEEAARREKRASEEIVALRADLDRVRERLEKARSEYSELRTSHTLLFTEIAETRADAGRSAELVGELQAELDRLRGLLTAKTGWEQT